MERKLSTFQLVLLAIFGALGIGAILIFALATAGGGGTGLSPVTMWGTLDATTMKNVLREASNTDSRLLDVTYVQKDPATYEAVLANALASGTGPDIYILQDDEALYDENKAYIIPYSQLSQSQFENAFVGAADPYLTPSGVLALPILVDPLVLYWNQDMLASAGIAQPPQYWDQLPAMSQALTQKDNSGALQKEAIALGTYSNIGAAKDILSMLMEQAGAQITGVNSSGTVVAGLSQGSSASAAGQALTFYTEFADPSEADYSWNDAQNGAQQTFAAGDLAMYIGYASEEPQITAANPNLSFAAAPVPQVRGATNAIDEGTVYALAIPKSGHNLESAITLAYLIASEPVDSALADAYGLAPARRDAITAGPQEPAAQSADSPPTTAVAPSPDATLFNDMALIVHTWISPDPTQTGSIFQAMIESTENGTIQVSDAISQADQQISQLLAQEQPQTQ